MDCPRCRAAMQEHTFHGHHGRQITIDLCEPCQSFWFDGRESLALPPGATLSLFRLIGEHTARPSQAMDKGKCPRCKKPLRRVQDMQRMTRFEYLKCVDDCGRLITFFDFLKEKDFVRPLSAQQIDELRRNVQTVNCSNCGAAIDLTQRSACAQCGSPLSMLDMKQAEKLVEQLRRADEPRAVDPALPLNLLRAKRQTEDAFRGTTRTDTFTWSSLEVDDSGLVGSGLSALARWLRDAD